MGAIIQREVHPFIAGFFSTFKPIPVLTVSQWAEKYRILPRSGSSAPGPWRNERTPYLVEIMDELSPKSPSKEIVFAKGSQIGASEAGLNWLMYLIDLQPGPLLALQPTEQTAMRWSKQRVSPSLRQCEKIVDRLPKRDGNTILQKDFTGGTLILSGSNSPAALASMPMSSIYFDEVDRYPDESGKEGDPIGLALRRMATFPRSKAFFSSTPTVMETSKIWSRFLDSDQRYYQVPCPHCGEYQKIDFSNLSWPKGEPKKVALACSHCGVLIDEIHKTKMLKNGKWIADKPGHWRVGFHLSSLYSPVGWLSWIEIARTFDNIEGKPEETKVFTNTILGLPYEETGEQIAAEFLQRRREAYRAEIPDNVLFLTLAVDVQQDWIAYEVCGWGIDEESWGIEYGELRGDLSILESRDQSKPSIWEQIDQLRRSVYQKQDGSELRIACTVIDSGGWWTDEVYAFTKPRNKFRVFAVKGGSQYERPFMSKPTRNTKNKCLLFVLGVGKGKSLIYQRLKNGKVGSGYCHFSDDEARGYNPEYYAGLTSERLVMKNINGRLALRWDKPKGVSNEPLDIRVYGTAAIRILNPPWTKIAKRSNYIKKSTAQAHAHDEPEAQIEINKQKPKKKRPTRTPIREGISLG